MRYRIGPPGSSFELDLTRECLLREGVGVHLSPKTFRVAAHLVGNSGRLVLKDELLSACWAGAAASDDVLAHAIANLRQALGDNPREPSFIQTVPRRGYRFIAEVTPLAPDNPETSPLTQAECRTPGDDISRDQPAVTSPLQPVPVSALVARGIAYSPARFGAVALVLLLAAAGSFLLRAPRQRLRSSPSVLALTASLPAARAYLNGVESARQYRPAEAIAQFEEALRLDPGFTMARARIGYVYSVRWLWEEKGRRYLEAAFAQRSRLNDLNRHYILAWYDLAHRDYPGAVATLRQLITTYPAEIEAREELGRILLGEGQYAAAKAELEQAIRINSGAPQAHNILSAVFAATHNFPGAIREAQEFVRLLPDEVNAHDTLGMAFEAANRFEDAEKEYRWILARQPKFPSRIHLANTLFKMGRWREARAEIEAYIANAASDAERQWGYDQLAVLALHQGNDDDVLRYASFQPRDGYHDPEVLLALRRRDLPRADRLLDQRPPHADRGQRANSRLELVVRAERALVSSGSASIPLFRQAVAQRTPLYSIDWYEDSLAQAWLRLGRYPEAIAEFRRILSIYPRLALAWYGLAQALFAQGDEQQARQAFAKVAEIWAQADPGLLQRLESRLRPTSAPIANANRLD